MHRILNILFWAVISAAFIGPGTITTAASAGATFQYALLWALLFSTVACIILQEASARVTIVSGRPLGQAIRDQFQGRTAKLAVTCLIVVAIVLGCAAYEAGNILGGVAGAMLALPFPRHQLTLLVGFAAAVLLFFGKTRLVARILGGLVALMGVAFLTTAVSMKPPLLQLFKGTFVPVFPGESGLLILGLIGTTVVPYNLFLGSGIAHGEKLSEMRFGLTVAVVLGGVISMGVLIVGTAVEGNFSFSGLSEALVRVLGHWAGTFFAVGLFAAGFSSAITAPLAAAMTAKSLFDHRQEKQWNEDGPFFRGVWLFVLLTGLLFGIADVRPIPAIILAQAFNGVLLPFVAVFLLLVVNDRRLMTHRTLNGPLANTMTALVVMVTIFLGLSGILRAGAAILNMPPPSPMLLLWTGGTVVLLLAWPVYRQIRYRRQVKF